MVGEGALELAVHEGCHWDVAALDAVARATGARTERIEVAGRHLLAVSAD